MNRHQVCASKVRYSTKKKAIAAAMSIRDREPNIPLLTHYACPCGEHFHLTKQDNVREQGGTAA